MRVLSYTLTLTIPRAASAAGVALLVMLATSGRTSAQAQDVSPSADQLTALKGQGEEVYTRECEGCHGAQGNGDGAGPALDGNTNLSNKDHVLKRIIEGSPEKGMDPFGKTLGDRDIAAVATFVRNAWNNAYGVVVDADVKKMRDAFPAKK